MKRVIVKYGCGYGSHWLDFEVEDDATAEEIEQEASDAARERFWWSHELEDEED